jgi:PTH1 family peptidyl-tRNA hydrolase
LKPPRREEQIEIDVALERALELWLLIEKADWNAAMQRVNTRPATPKLSKETPA